MKTLKILNVVGARPNFMKIAPICEEMARVPAIESVLLHTGQHYDRQMSALFFDHLGIPQPDVDLGIGSGGHGEQTGRIMIAFEAACREHRPEVVVVVGDVNSTIACGLVAVKLGIRLAHVEAGLRSYDRSMPEEVNRVLTDQISDYLFTTERSAHGNLAREGIAREKVFFVGNVMIDSLLAHREKAREQSVLADLGLPPRGYVLVTLHRPSNVDDRETLSGLLEALAWVAARLPVVFPVHPRTRKQIEGWGLGAVLARQPGLRLLEPMGYLDFLQCLDNASFVVTDSGGIQEETTALGVPCLTARENTERPVTVTQGTNIMVGRDPAVLRQQAERILDGERKSGRLPELWDGKAAGRIVGKLLELEGRARGSAPSP